MNKTYVKSVLALVTICLVIALALGLVNMITAPIIKDAENAATIKALAEVRPGAEKFTSINLNEYSNIPEGVTEAYSADDIGGFVVKLSVTGYQSGMVILVGIDEGGKVTGAKCLASSETLGYQETYGERFTDKTLADVDEVDTISNATKTTAAYKKAVKYALGTAQVLSGGDFDTRTEEERKLDEALPGAKGKFTSQFIAVKLAGLTKVFKADNNTGYVLVVNGEYIAADSDGNITATGTNADLAKGYIEQINAVTLTDIDLTAYNNLPVSLTAASKTNEGIYVFTLQSEPNYYGNRIVIKVAVTSEGKIVDCMTVSQGESEGYGDVCGTVEYYKQYVGADTHKYYEKYTSNTLESFDEVIISNATNTTTSYNKLIADAYAALEKMKGGQ